jgi:hypothetical protein
VEKALRRLKVKKASEVEGRPIAGLIVIWIHPYIILTNIDRWPLLTSNAVFRWPAKP